MPDLDADLSTDQPLGLGDEVNRLTRLGVGWNLNGLHEQEVALVAEACEGADRKTIWCGPSDL